MKNKVLFAVIITAFCFATYLVSISPLSNKIKFNQDVRLKETDVWSNFATSSIPADLKTELIAKVKNQITQKRGDGAFENVLVTSAFSRSNIIGRSPELVIGTWKSKDVWSWFSYSNNGAWKTFIDFDGYDCDQIKSLPRDVIRQLAAVNLPSIQMCGN